MGYKILIVDDDRELFKDAASLFHVEELYNNYC